jgi:hypothetical protein
MRFLYLVASAVLTCAVGLAQLPSSQSAALLTQPEQCFLTSAGTPLASGQIFTYVAGTSTPQAAYTDSTAGTPLANPVVLSANGCTQIWLGATLSYKIVAEDALNNVQWTADNVNEPALYYVQQLKNYITSLGTASTITYTSALTGGVSRTLASKEGDIISIIDLGGVADGVTDNASVINAALQHIPTGGSLVFPCSVASASYLIASPITFPTGARHITVSGTDPGGCEILYQTTTASILAAVNLNGTDSVTMRYLNIFANGAGSFAAPAVVMLLARNNSSNAAGHHNFDHVTVSGYANTALVYSIASEQDSWIDCYFNLNGGSAIQAFHTSNNDDANICGGGTNCVASTNLSLFMLHAQVGIFASSGSSASTAAFYDQMCSSCGDHIYRDGYVGLLSGGHGSAFKFVADPSNAFSGYNYEVSNYRAENGDSFAWFDKGVQTDGYISGIRMHHNTSAGQSVNVFWGTAHAHMVQCDFESNETVSGGNPPTSFDYVDQSRFSEDYTSVFTVRTIMTNSTLDYRGSSTPVIACASYNDFVDAHQTSWVYCGKTFGQGVWFGGPLYISAVATGLSGQAPIVMLPGADPTTFANGDMWISSADNRWYGYFSAAKQQVEFQNFNTLLDQCGNGSGGSSGTACGNTIAGAFSLDQYGRIQRQGGGSSTVSVSSCGSGASVVGNDNWGLIAAGTASPLHSCLLTFGHVFGTQPVCVAGLSSGVGSVTAAASTGGVTFSGFQGGSATDMSSWGITYICTGL